MIIGHGGANDSRVREDNKRETVSRVHSFASPSLISLTNPGGQTYLKLRFQIDRRKLRPLENCEKECPCPAGALICI
jgi:hypothetical protein